MFPLFFSAPEDTHPVLESTLLHTQNKTGDLKKKKQQHFISVLSIKCTVRDGVRMLCILREIKTGT